MSELRKILPPDLEKNITPAEEKVLENVPVGKPTFLQAGNKKIDDPANADNWDDSRTIRAKFLYWLCTDEDATKLVHAKGVEIYGAKIQDKLDFEGAYLPRPLFLIFSAIPEGIILLDAITRTFAFSESHTGKISADRLRVEGSVFLRGVRVNGEVRFLGATINGDLDCNGAEFQNADGNAFVGDGLSVKGRLFLRGTHAEGEVRLLSASIEGNLDCENAIFKVQKNVDQNNKDKKGKKNKAFSGDGLSVKGGLFLREVRAEGEVGLLGASIQSRFECDGAKFNNPDGDALNVGNMRVNGPLFLRSTQFDGILNLNDTKVKELVDDKASWPKKGMLRLDGFEYESLVGSQTPRTAKERLAWLRLQPNEPFHYQPYEQLADVFRRLGRDADVRKVLIAKQNDFRKYGELGRLAKFGKWISQITTGYGYQPWRPLLIFFSVFLVVGGFFFSWAHETGFMLQSSVQVDQSGYPQFQPAMYSLDVLLPLVDLHQESYWLPDMSLSGAPGVRWYFWVHKIIGWLLSALTVAWLTGLLRKD